MIIRALQKKIELSKAGNPFARVLVQFDEYKDGKGNRRWISGFGNKRTWAWRIGDDVSPEITENGKYLNFSFDDTDDNRLNVYALPATVGFVMDLLKPRERSEPRETQTANEEIAPDDIPF